MAIRRPARQPRSAAAAAALLAAVGVALLLWMPPSGSSSTPRTTILRLPGISGLTAPAGPTDDDVLLRCQGTRGAWCTAFHAQEAAPVAPPRRGNHSCSLDCNQVGTCDALAGLCTCPAGWHGWNCLHPLKRHCIQRHEPHGYERGPQPPDLAAGVGWESIFGFPESHCAGACDDALAACYCPSSTPYGRVPAAADAPPGSPPARRGRPMGFWCQPNRTEDGRATAWGTVDPELLWGPRGWCTAAEPAIQCPCPNDGWGGKNCEEPFEQFCFNQCNGRGECLQGYCKCHPGWHGIDCAHASAAADTSRPGLQQERPWIADHIHTPAAHDAPIARPRPLIYVYELPAEYSTLMLQYRWGGEQCTPRTFAPGNATVLSSWTYTAEAGFLEALLQSDHRTLDPEQADLFFVPALPSCWFEIRDRADSLHDFFYSVAHNRAQGATNLLLEAYHWLRAHHPWWDRRGGRDHIWLVTHDEASCYVPAAIRSSIILSHWGRRDANHTSGTGYSADNYSAELTHPQFEPRGWQHKLGSHPCYDADKDLVIPLMKTPNHFHQSPLLGAPARNRTWLAFHRGRVQHENPAYSRGIRQRLDRAAKEGRWLETHGIVVGEHSDVAGDYSELLASSVFCLVLPGDGWSARMEDATLHGCLPVIIMDNVHVSFESILDLEAFTLRIPEKDAERLPEVLLAVPEEQRQQMQRALARVWHRFAYGSYRPYARRWRELQQQHAAARRAAAAAAPPASLPAAVPDAAPEVDDAFLTIMQWLHARI